MLGDFYAIIFRLAATNARITMLCGKHIIGFVGSARSIKADFLKLNPEMRDGEHYC